MGEIVIEGDGYATKDPDLEKDQIMTGGVATINRKSVKTSDAAVAAIPGTGMHVVVQKIKEAAVWLKIKKLAARQESSELAVPLKKKEVGVVPRTREMVSKTKRSRRENYLQNRTKRR